LVYEDYGGGDVVFFVDGQPVVGCESGFWLRPTDAGFKSSFATLLSAYATKLPIIVYGLNDQLWPGSSGHVCRVSALRPT